MEKGRKKKKEKKKSEASLLLFLPSIGRHAGDGTGVINYLKRSAKTLWSFCEGGKERRKEGKKKKERKKKLNNIVFF